MMSVFFDLDGTLIDARMRLYKLFCDLTGQTLLSFQHYWNLKRNRHNQRWLLTNILGYDENQISEFKSKWMENIEKDDYLQFDKLFPFTIAILDTLKKKGHPLFLISARQNKMAAMNQLSAMRLTTYFNECFIASPPQTKTEAIQLQNLPLDKNDFLVGDTSEDVEAARNLRIKSIAVLSGFNNYKSIKASHPDYIVKDISEIPNYIITAGNCLL